MAKKRRIVKEIIRKNHLGITLGVFFALLHAIWAFLVATGIGQRIFDWIFPLHFIDNMYYILDFNLATAVFLVIAAFIGGYVMGWLFAAMYNEFAEE